jgi:hypothetical protein
MKYLLKVIVCGSVLAAVCSTAFAQKNMIVQNKTGSNGIEVHIKYSKNKTIITELRANDSKQLSGKRVPLGVEFKNLKGKVQECTSHSSVFHNPNPKDPEHPIGVITLSKQLKGGVSCSYMTFSKYINIE